MTDSQQIEIFERLGRIEVTLESLLKEHKQHAVDMKIALHGDRDDELRPGIFKRIDRIERVFRFAKWITGVGTAIAGAIASKYFSSGGKS